MARKNKSKGGKKTSVKIASPPGGGLRPLSLLQDRDVNQEKAVKPLVFGKKQKAADENADPAAGLQGKVRASFKPLKLSRSETTKEGTQTTTGATSACCVPDECTPVAHISRSSDVRQYRVKPQGCSRFRW